MQKKELDRVLGVAEALPAEGVEVLRCFLAVLYWWFTVTIGFVEGCTLGLYKVFMRVLPGFYKSFAKVLVS